jgi:hypothetical protein
MKRNKILKYKEIKEHLYDDDDYSGYKKPTTTYTKEQKEKDKEKMMNMETTEDEDYVLSDLCILLKKMFENSNFDNVYVGSEGLAITVQIYFEKVEKLSSIKGILDILVKLKNDTLKGYDSELTLYETEEDEEPFMEVVFFQRDNNVSNIHQEEVDDRSNILGTDNDGYPIF